jgi:hypothetical protein
MGPDCGCAVPGGPMMPATPMMPGTPMAPAYPPRTTLPNVVPPPMTDPAPAPIPGNAPGTAADPTGLPALPGSDVPAAPTTNWKPNTKKSPQLVSYEEFQRLPGQVISTRTPAPTALNEAQPAELPALPQVTPASSSAPASAWTPSRSH